MGPAKLGDGSNDWSPKRGDVVSLNARSAAPKVATNLLMTLRVNPGVHGEEIDRRNKRTENKQVFVNLYSKRHKKWEMERKKVRHGFRAAMRLTLDWGWGIEPVLNYRGLH